MIHLGFECKWISLVSNGETTSFPSQGPIHCARSVFVFHWFDILLAYLRQGHSSIHKVICGMMESGPPYIAYYYTAGKVGGLPYLREAIWSFGLTL